METNKSLCVVVITVLAGCGGVEGDVSYYEAEARGGGGGTTPPPTPSCAPATCFENTTAALPGQPLDSAIVAESFDITPALKATADATSAGRFVSQSHEGLVTYTSDPNSGAALETATTQTTGETYGLLAETYSAAAAALTVRATAILMDLNNGTLWFSQGGFVVRNGQQLGEFGPTGPQGPQGDKGDTGSQGDKGDNGTDATFAMCGEGTTCSGVCKEAIVVQASGPCEVTSDVGGCSWSGTNGVCCVCAL